MSDAAMAARAIALLDLTSLEESDDEAKITALCRRAETQSGPVAAVCVYSRFVALARRLLAGRVRIATVANFPAGTAAITDVAAEVRAAIAAGADEVDVVFPYAGFLPGDTAQAAALVAAARDAAQGRVLKIILETGRLAAPEIIAAACDIAIAGGADFLKTSTGKLQPAATPEAARVLLTSIAASKRPVGFKAAGGIRTLRDAATYIDLADEIMGPGWAKPENFRLGASALLDDLLRVLGLATPAQAADTRY